jgi:hypothetical protein
MHFPPERFVAEEDRGISGQYAVYDAFAGITHDGGNQFVDGRVVGVGGTGKEASGIGSEIETDEEGKGRGKIRSRFKDCVLFRGLHRLG